MHAHKAMQLEKEILTFVSFLFRRLVTINLIVLRSNVEQFDERIVCVDAERNSIPTKCTWVDFVHVYMR